MKSWKLWLLRGVVCFLFLIVGFGVGWFVHRPTTIEVAAKPAVTDPICNSKSGPDGKNPSAKEPATAKAKSTEEEKKAKAEAAEQRKEDDEKIAKLAATKAEDKKTVEDLERHTAALKKINSLKKDIEEGKKAIERAKREWTRASPLPLDKGVFVRRK